MIAAVILLLFGAKKIPELARSLGRASYEFKKAKQDLMKETQDIVDTAENAAKAADSEKSSNAQGPEQKQTEKDA